MKMSRNFLLIGFASILVALFVAFAFVGSTSYESSKAEDGLIPQFTIGASVVGLGTNPNVLSTFNNGYSFAFFGTFSNDANTNFTINTPQLNFDTSLMSMRFNFSNSNVDNRLLVLNVSLFGYDFDDNITDNFYTLTGINATSLNSYFNDVFITIGSHYDKISMYVEVAVTSGYVEFAFNDFSIDFFSDFKIAYENGYKDGYDAAKDEFYQSRYDLGYNAGFIEGSNNEFSFLSYFGAIIETPINAALSLFDFDFLGFNMRAFVLSILTISLVIVIIKFALAR